MNMIENQICEAIELIVNRAVEQANYDKTIQATVVSCVDATIGKYKVKYQDSTFYAYAGSSDVTYSNGANVYILVPGNDTSADKTILGTTKKLGINYVTTVEGDEAYQIIGNNVITSTATFGLSSYKADKQVKVLYSKQYSLNKNLISLNQTAIGEYIKGQKTIICGGVIRTALPAEQQFRGNYGIIFALNFKDNTENSTVTRYYTVDVDKMSGNPYKILYDTRQYGIFDIDGENFIDVDSISLFCYDFPNSKPDNQCIDDIFIKDIELCGAERLSEEDIRNYSLTFVTPQGTFFDKSSLSSDIRTIKAEVRVKGKVVDNNSQSLPFYWFIEHVGITSQSKYYNQYGGQGWKCLNEYNVIKKATSSDSEVVEWIPNSYEWKVKKLDITAKEVKFKCAVVYDGTVISREISIKNLASDYDITIESDEGTKFYFDIGTPTLKCLVNGKEDKNLTYSWAVFNNTNNFESIAETPDISVTYSEIYGNYQQLLKDIEEEKILVSESKDILAEYHRILKEFDSITRVEGNTIWNINVNTITNFSTYKCTVYQGDLYLGTVAIILTNSLEAEGQYSMVINNGAQVFKYDVNGVSPASSAQAKPISISALGITVYDNLGNVIDSEIVKHSDIQWIVPIGNTMIEIPNSYEDYEEDLIRGVRIYKNIMSLAYNIASRYDVTKTNNTIQVIINYKDVIISAETDLVFTKEGESGTNGTEFFCRVVPNVRNGEDAPLYPMITELSNYDYSLNYQTPQLNKFLKVQLWRNETKILDSVTSAISTEGKLATIKWSVLKNKYTSTVSDESALIVNENTGVFNYQLFNYNSPANIIKAEVEYDGVIYYAVISVITVKMKDDNYRLELKENTGFNNVLYSADGKVPRYDNTNPFEIITTQKVNGYWEDVSLKETSAYAVEYVWDYQLGRIYENDKWSYQDVLKQAAEIDVYYQNQIALKPKDDYDGQCVTNALLCIVKKSGKEIGRIHIPIHLLLNRYGNSAINGWDGNSVQVSEEGGFILSPQVGAGKKESDNSFTGVLMGKVKEAGKSQEDIGLLGYSKGVRSYFLDSEDGSAIFGTKNNGKMIIDPSQSKALLYSWNYWKSYTDKGKPSNYNESNVNDKGMLINLTDSLIHFGSSQSGKIYSGVHSSLGSTQKGFYLSQDGLSIGKGFLVATNGLSELTHEGSNLGNWRVEVDENGDAVGLISKDGTGIFLDSESSTIVLGSSAGKIYSGVHSSIDDTDPGFFLSNKGLSIVSKNNNQTSKFILKTDGTPVMYSNGHSYLDSTQSGFYLGQDGLAITNKWTEDGQTLTSSLKMKTSGNPEIYSNGHSSLGSTRDGFYLGNSGLSIGSKVYIDKDGDLRLGGGAVANSGKHWSISGDSDNSYIKYGDMNDTNSVYISTNMISLGKKFYADDTGVVRVGNGAVAADGKYWTIDGNSSRSYIAYGGTSWQEADSDTDNTTKVYLGTDGISLGKRFSVSDKGEVKAYSGILGGWKISKNKITATDGTMELQSSGKIKGGTSYAWSIDSAGTATFNRIKADKGGTIGNCNISENGLYSSSDSGSWYIKADGTASFNQITATGGKIGGWTINTSSLTGGNMYINSNGSIGGSNWSISTVGKASFSNIDVTGGSITLGGSTLNSRGTNLTANKTTVGTKSLQTYVEELAVGKLTASNVTITASLDVGNSTHYLRMGQGTKNPEVSGLNIGSEGIAVQEKSGQTVSSIQFVSDITSVNVDAYMEGLVPHVGITINFKTRNFTFTSGIMTNITNSSSQRVD